MAKMVATPIYMLKTFRNPLQNQKYQRLKPYKVNKNDDPEFLASSDFVFYLFEWVKLLQSRLIENDQLTEGLSL